MAATTSAFEAELLAGAFTARDRGLMAGAAYRLRHGYLGGGVDPGIHTAVKLHPRQLKALTDTGMLASFDAITAP